MLRRYVCAAVAFLAMTGLVLADEFVARITKVDGNAVTFVKFSKDKKGEPETLKATKDVKVVTGKFNKEDKKVEAGEEIKGGLKSERFEKIGKFGVFAQIITKGDKITEIRVFGGKGKGKKKKDAE